MTETTARFDALAARVSREFDAIHERHRARMECGRGCTDCCRCRLSITPIEAALIRRELARRPLEVREEIATRAANDESGMCPALDAGGRCQIYEARPLACRVHGAPLRYRYPVPLIRPTRIDVCEKNFKDVALDSLADEDVIDRTRLSERLIAIDPRAADERIPLAQVLADSV